MTELLACLVRPLADQPGDVQITATRQDRTTVLRLRVGAADLGTIIGKQGRTAKALRTVLAAAGAKRGERVVLEIAD